MIDEGFHLVVDKQQHGTVEVLTGQARDLADERVTVNLARVELIGQEEYLSRGWSSTSDPWSVADEVQDSVGVHAKLSGQHLGTHGAMEEHREGAVYGTHGEAVLT